jgi:bifunctional DNA-binding transcriptional regulator/antitoxin component of YhaV-PrlF toxin-antitoxin module
MQIKVYKDGKILLPLDLRKKYNIIDNSELIITECEDGIKISTKNLLLASLRDEFASVNLSDELNDLRQDEFTREICG